MTAPVNLKFFEVDPTLEGTRLRSNVLWGRALNLMNFCSAGSGSICSKWIVMVTEGAAMFSKSTRTHCDGPWTRRLSVKSGPQPPARIFNQSCPGRHYEGNINPNQICAIASAAAAINKATDAAPGSAIPMLLSPT